MLGSPLALTGPLHIFFFPSHWYVSGICSLVINKYTRCAFSHARRVVESKELGRMSARGRPGGPC